MVFQPSPGDIAIVKKMYKCDEGGGGAKEKMMSVLRARNNSTKMPYQELIFHDVAVLDLLAPKPYD